MISHLKKVGKFTMEIENKVNDLISELTINDVDFTMEGIADFLGVFLMINSKMSCYMEHKNQSIICIQKNDPDRMWEDFTHELGHYILHDTNQTETNELLNYKQEKEADKFALLFQMPQQLIEDYELFSERDLSAFFNIHLNQARKRLEMLYNYYFATSPVGV